MRYFWHGAFLGSFLFAPWWATVLIGTILAFKHSPEILIIGVFFLIDLIQAPLTEKFYLSMPLSLGAIIFVLFARFVRSRLWQGVLN